MTFRSAEVIRLWYGLRAVLLEYWYAMSRLEFASAAAHTDAARVQAEARHARALESNTCPDHVLDDYFLFVTALDALHLYAAYWDSLMQGLYSQTWSLLQDLQGSLRLIKRFGRRPDIRLWVVLEEQCAAVERLYPYRWYVSAEMIHGPLVCSVCGRSMDAPTCPHIPGDLYRGRLALGVVREIISAPAIALVSNPMDKRCVAVLPDDDEHFHGPGTMRTAVRDGHLAPLRFAGVESEPGRTTPASPEGSRGGVVADLPGHTGRHVAAGTPVKRKEDEHLTLVCSRTPVLDVEDLLRLRRARRSVA